MLVVFNGGDGVSHAAGLILSLVLATLQIAEEEQAEDNPVFNHAVLFIGLIFSSSATAW